MNGYRAALLAGVGLTVWGCKRHYAISGVEDIKWMLWPVAALTGRITRSSFEFETGAGYLSRESFFLIAKPCAGINFMLATLGMIAWILSKHAVSWRSTLSVAALCLGVSYVAAILANTARIRIALWLAAPSPTGWWTAARFHRVEGIVVYFGVLMVLHWLVCRSANAVLARGDR